MKYADIDWLANGNPVSKRFQDVYFSQAGGIEETQHVFHQGNDLPLRWSEGPEFKIGELGFGSGLSFFTTVKKFRETAKPGSRLHYLSFEIEPWSVDDLKRFHANHGWLDPDLKHFIQNFPPLIEGIHVIRWNDVSLTLVLGDAREQIKTLRWPAGAVGIQAWFLHGFAPGKNPELWERPLFEELARLSAEHCTFSTFTVSSSVRGNLESAGFEANLVAGFSRKREMLRGKLLKSRPDSYHPALPRRMPKAPIRSAVIIGGGLAGCATAYELTRAGIHVTLIERNAKIAQETSGNPAGLVMPFLAQEPDPKCLWALRSVLAVTKQISQWPDLRAKSGVLELLTSEAERDRIQEAIKRLDLPSNWAAIRSESEVQTRSGLGESLKAPFGAVDFSLGLRVSPVQLCEKYLAEKSRLEVKTSTEALRFEFNAGEWQVFDSKNQKIANAQSLILANSTDATAFAQSSELPLVSVRGQMAQMHAPENIGELRCALVAEHSLIPLSENEWWIGATYERLSTDHALRETESLNMKESFSQWVPSLHSSQAPTGGRVSFRTYSPDAMPLVGALPNTPLFNEQFRDWHKGHPWTHYTEGNMLPQAWCSLAHGSRGIATTLLAARVLKAELTGELYPVESRVLDALHPARFQIRKLQKNQIEKTT